MVVVLRDENGNINDVEYQYHLKDHPEASSGQVLGNVRVTFKTEEETDAYQATFEDDAETKSYESTYFSRYGEVTRINADIFDHTDAGTSNTYSSRLNGTGNEVYGLAKSLEVKPGDKVSAEVWAKYLDPSTTGASGSAFAQLIEDLSNNASTVVVDGATAGTNPNIPFVGMINHGSGISGAPKAYINMLVFDLNYNLVNSSFEQVPADAFEDGSGKQHKQINTATMTITQPGYVYIYLSNENGTAVEVFFDDFMVTHENTEIVQKDDYYPFGLTFNSYIRTASTAQNYLYNGKELLDDLNLNLYDYGARYFDPVIGRWTSPDPMSSEREWISPYNFVQNNPMLRVDPDGMLDDYYDREGRFLYRDTKTTDNIRIIDQKGFDAIASKHGSDAMNDQSTSNLGLLGDLEGKSKSISGSGISAKAASNIFTDILDKAGFDVSKLHNGKVSIDGGPNNRENFNDGSNLVLGQIASGQFKGQINPATGGPYTYTGNAPDGTIKVTGMYNSKSGTADLTTVSNVVSSLGVHEYKGHAQMRLSHTPNDHHKIYMMQKNHPTFNSLTPSYRQHILNKLK